MGPTLYQRVPWRRRQEWWWITESLKTSYQTKQQNQTQAQPVLEKIWQLNRYFSFLSTIDPCQVELIQTRQISLTVKFSPLEFLPIPNLLVLSPSDPF